MPVPALIASAIQLAIVLGICVVVWWLSRRKVPGSFWTFVGLLPCPPWLFTVAAVLGAGLSWALLQWPPVHAAAQAPGTVVAATIRSGLTWRTAISLAVLATIKTALSEELLFRGLIGKFLIRWRGFRFGNAAQAVLFGAVHLPLAFLPGVERLSALAFVASATAMGWISGWLNEKYGKGSILPGWAAHAAANLISYLGLAFGLV